ncbi:MAG TPA: hypothetical protein VF172_02285 [Nitrososphaera sp.]
MKGETQLRARRTRIKILRAIADKNGLAGFSDIKMSTGLSTGSIYYHLERMSNYVTKDSKHYIITEEGLQFLREADPKYAGISPRQANEEQQTTKAATQDGPEEPVRQTRHFGARRLVFAGVITVSAASALIFASMFADWQIMAAFTGTSTGIILSLGTAAALLTSFLVFGRHSYPQIGYKGTVLSALALGIVVAGVVVFSSPELIGAAPSQPYDNSMDALRSSYSMHWQIR